MDAVLFVDDDEDLREVMRDILKAVGVQHIVTAASLREVQDLRDEAVGCELAIIDINLGPGEPNGVSLYEWLEHEGFRGGVVFLTGHAANDPRVQEAATFAGSAVASKPLSVAELRDLIGRSRHAI